MENGTKAEAVEELGNEVEVESEANEVEVQCEAEKLGNEVHMAEVLGHVRFDGAEQVQPESGEVKVQNQGESHVQPESGVS
ncbi:hypothetical protein DEO72_LG2g3937 [Vigna unguiculata]|uniref:Uncharacterized protein n=1 Tax=Vigna unguiculata TaxID=3917 RepID=A0A4D6L502_VIGUN|nr:hypothetical protein DEO72_LG2g3937 [Vigna unguiculata]